MHSESISVTDCAVFSSVAEAEKAAARERDVQDLTAYMTSVAESKGVDPDYLHFMIATGRVDKNLTIPQAADLLVQKEQEKRDAILKGAQTQGQSAQGRPGVPPVVSGGTVGQPPNKDMFEDVLNQPTHDAFVRAFIERTKNLR